MITPLLALSLALTAGPGEGGEASRDLVFLAEHRPVFLRLRVTTNGRPFEATWVESVRTVHATLDRNSDGKVTTKEADDGTLAALIRLATGSVVPVSPSELDVVPKDGEVSVAELATALRRFRLQVGRQAVGRTDALFDQLDRDKDGQLTRPELSAITGSLRPLDLDDNGMISADELEPFNSPAGMAITAESLDRQARFTALPPVVELVAGESTLRPARLLFKKYDKGKGDVPGRPDGKLSPSEFAVDPSVFAGADKNGDESLDTDEVRRFLTGTPVDLTLDVTFPPPGSGHATVKAVGGDLPKGAKLRQLDEGDVEFAIGQVRIDVRADEGAAEAQAIRRLLAQRFKLLDTNKDGYLEGKERVALGAANTPLAGLADVIDRDGDGKLYLKELHDFADRQTEAARGRLVVATADQGRAIFGILDLDRDRRLGPREVMRTVDRVMSWDADSDGRVSADEIPYHFQVVIARGTLAGLTGEAIAAPAPRSMTATSPSAGPDWFQRMDRNHDGDISRREFLGPRDDFDRLDGDKDGLIDAGEAALAGAKTAKGGGIP